MNDKEMIQLEQAIQDIMDIANSFGLDYFPMQYEVCPADIIYTIAAYGMPTRFSHWSFGKSFHRMKLQYDFNLNRIYELVVNSNPCYAFLLDGNNLIQNKLVSAHVLGHSDFFKNNNRFRNTSRNMIESMSVAAERIRSYELEYGIQTVEEFLDSVISIQEHIDPTLFRNTNKNNSANEHVNKKKSELTSSARATEYDDLWELDDRQYEKENNDRKPRLSACKKFNKEVTEKDLLYFIMENSKILEPWQKDIISIIRDEMLYFWPQIETKIMNEGWASFS
ncbi:hypothetical protein BHF68_13855 [Desulfuribacillus alkaliarsenatis]|uniref:SpoVR protein-like N-terminal domain-containing protein n=1 Tax=Desulfuribacillus alkaliarsenatis TaxID=766136 RepID=A0A1E5G3W8_9FIRM|nr:SpoVR family protein [Desulfuribacillus alkaliarsenatis]OEF97769.1 hypothetical protein BHF68_13855 [Desulfuribacillus alkaliarsenatis]